MKAPEIQGLQCVALLTQGDLVATWKAVQESLQREVEVRIAQPGADHDQVVHFLDISRMIARLSHPHLAQIHDVVTGPEATYVVMEHVAGASLAEMAAGTGPLKSSQVLPLAEQLASAIDHAWTQAQIVFRNLKPQNIRVNSRGILKLSEFSLAVHVAGGVDPTVIDKGMVVGTPHYVSPEQARADADIDTRSDMYAFGAILYYLVTGTAPFEGKDQHEIFEKQISGQIPHPRTLSPSLPLPLCQLIARLMMKSPSERYANWTDILADIRRLQSGKGIVRPPATMAGSTVAPLAGSVGDAERPLKVRARQTAAAVRGAQSAERRGGRHFLLWLLMALWFAWLANARLDNPLGLPQQVMLELPEIAFPTSWLPSRPAADEAAGSIDAAKTAEAAGTVDTAGTAGTAEPAGTAATAEATVVTGGAAGTAETAEPAAAARTVAAAASDAPSAAIPPAVLARAAAALRTDGVPGAIRVLEEAGAVADPMRRALESLPSTAALLEEGLRAQTGKEIVIRHMGRERRIITARVADGELAAAFLSDGGSRPITLRLDSLDAAEQLRWLPAARTPAEHAVHGILALQSGNTASLREHQDAAGILAPLFRITP